MTRSTRLATLAIDHGVERCPAGQWREDDVFGSGEVGGAAVLTSAASFVLGGAIEPGALEVVAFEQRLRAANARPLLGPFDETFLDALTEDVGEAGDLRFLLVGDGDA